MTPEQQEESRQKNEFIVANYLTMSNVQMGRKMGISEKSVRQRILKLNLPPKNQLMDKSQQVLTARANEFELQLEANGLENNWSIGWLKTEKSSILVRNPKGDIDLKEDIIQKLDEILDRYSIKGIKTFQSKNTKSKNLCQVVLTDEHLGLSPHSKSNPASFKYEYNADLYKKSIKEVFENVVSLSKLHNGFEEVILLDLGDAQDGYNALTTRGGHTLQQNMTNSEVFEVYVDTKVSFIESIIKENITNKITIRSVVNSNHSSDFSLIINKTIQKIIQKMYPKVFIDFDIIEEFMAHRYYGKHCLIYTHGKDKKERTRGFPYNLDLITTKYINDYINHHNIDKNCFIHVLKGDLHKLGFQKENNFSYRNFMSFAPPSLWVTTNFGDSYSGYTIQIYDKEKNNITNTDYYLDYKSL